MEASQSHAAGCRPSCKLAPQLQTRPLLLASCRQARVQTTSPHARLTLASKRPSLTTRRCYERRRVAKRAAGAMAVYTSTVIAIMSDAMCHCGPFWRSVVCNAFPADAESAAPSASGLPEGSDVAAEHGQLKELDTEGKAMSDHLSKKEVIAIIKRLPQAEKGSWISFVNKHYDAICWDGIAADEDPNVLLSFLQSEQQNVVSGAAPPGPAAPGPLAEPQASLGQMMAEIKRELVEGLTQELAGVVEALQDKPFFSSLSDNVLGKQTKQAQTTVRVEPEFMVAMAERQVPVGISSAIQALSGAQKESQRQEHLMTVVKAACQDFKTIPEMCVVDASTKGSGLPLAGFKDYIGDESRVDIVLSLTAEAHFPTMLGCLEVKPDLTKGGVHDEAVGQLRAREEQTRALVPGRKKFLGAVLDKQEIQLWLFTPGRTYHTDRVPIHWQKDDKGWQMLVGILAASYDQFGYVAPTPLPAFVDSKGEQVQECMPIRAHPRRPVYQAQRQGEPVIVKLGDADSIHTEVDALTAVGSHPNLPTLCAHGQLPSALPQGVTHYMVITPVGKRPKLEGGKTVGVREAKQRKRQFLMWMGAVVSALEHMHNQGWLHRDPTPYNVVTVSRTGAILLDLHLSVPVGSLEASYRSGTAAFWALSLHSSPSAQHTVSTDLEAVFYTFLYIASRGHALSWRYQAPGAMKRTKLSVMTDNDEWQEALSHCMDELRPTMSALRELFFPGGSLPAYKQHQVTVAEFKEAIKA